MRERANALIHNIKTMSQLHELEKEIILRNGSKNNLPVNSSDALEHQITKSKANRDNNTIKSHGGAYVRTRNKDSATYTRNTNNGANNFARGTSTSKSAKATDCAKEPTGQDALPNTGNSNGTAYEQSTSMSTKTGKSAKVSTGINMKLETDNGLSSNQAARPIRQKVIRNQQKNMHTRRRRLYLFRIRISIHLSWNSSIVLCITHKCSKNVLRAVYV